MPYTIPALIGAAGVVVALLSQPARAPTFRSDLEVVRLHALVTSGGRPVRGLTLADFEVYDNGVLQRLDLASFEQIPLDVVLVLDTSSSLSDAQLEELRAAGRAALSALGHEDRVALVTFSEAVTLAGGLTPDRSLIERALSEVRAGGGTALLDGVYAGLVISGTADGRGLVLVFSDGIDTASWLPERHVLDAARRSEVALYGVASGAGARMLEDIAKATGGRTYRVASTRDLPERFLQIVTEFRERYVLSYTPRGVAKSGWHRLDVRVKGRRVEVRARPGYLAESP